ncbi:hypothetical protein FACS1894142_8410 [Spirochaetia bacterium]|nr:hypothetical protein FACS1894142_8410 [Spirochaetia bacterium]
MVYETFLNDLPGIGSVCSGGRYDNLTGLYAKEPLPGVGSSIGLDRLIAALESLGKLQEQQSYAQAAIACVHEDAGGAYQALAERFRQAGIACEVFPEAKKLTQQYILAEKKGARWVIIPGEDPINGPLTLREIRTRQDRENLNIEDSIALIRN